MALLRYGELGYEVILIAPAIEAMSDLRARLPSGVALKALDVRLRIRNDIILRPVPKMMMMAEDE
jgi:alpha-beta hydrolase superfamily lysophospholipase